MQKVPKLTYTEQEAAEALGVSVRALSRARGSRELAFHQDRPRARVFYLRADLEAWATRGRVEAKDRA